ncbi:MAG: hypothetical protein LAT63_16900 [Marinobacter sp.]|nr:hypothetical protein [Marinobacter sp.]
MLNLTLWADRIATPTLKVDLAANLDAAKQAARLPSVMLVPGRDQVASAALSAGSRHRVTAEVLVVTGVRRGNQALGEQMVDELRQLRGPTLHALINWIPDGADTEVTWQGGQLLALTSSALYWVDAFRTDYWWTP